MYRYSQRLSWSFLSNPLAKLLEEKRAAGVPLLDLTISNPTAILPDYPNEAIAAAYAAVSDFTYYPSPTGLEEAKIAIAEYYARSGIPVSPSQLLLTASTSEAYALLFKLFCNPQDEVLVPRPSYPLFEYLAGLECVRTVPYRLLYDGAWSIDFEDLRERVTPRTRAIVAVNPNNPTGSFLSAADFERLTNLADRSKVPIISDEVFRDYGFSNPPDRVTTLIGHDAVLSFSLNGLSKLAGMPQMKLGWITINGPAQEREIARQRLELLLDTYLSVNTPVQRALPGLLRIGMEVQRQIVNRTKHNWDVLRDLLNGSPAHPLHTEGGWSAIIQLPGTLSEEIWTARLLDEQSVIVQPGYFFDMTSEPYMVVSLITPPENFREGIDRLRRMIG
ncbi:MAG: pyridoxal phosphate-dependent aminotransferase [Acidobacteriaceae bacterium]|nr:pyridoxal phosphate-dependent aminotransferase [Acidobacteriaceae bacterium]